MLNETFSVIFKHRAAMQCHARGDTSNLFINYTIQDNYPMNQQQGGRRNVESKEESWLDISDYFLTIEL